MDIRELVAKLGLEVDKHSFERGREAIEGLHLGFKAFAVAAGAAVAGALVHFTRETAEAADAAGKLAQSTGLNSEFLQKLSYAANLADVSTESLAVRLRHLAKTGVKNVQGEVLKLADQFALMPNDGAKVELAMKKFGRAGAQLIPLFKDGAHGIEELMQEAEDLGLVFSEEDSKAAEEFNDDTKRLGKSLTGLRNNIGRVLIPVLHSLVNGLRTFMLGVRKTMPAMRDFVLILKIGVVAAISLVTAAFVSNAVAALAAAAASGAFSLASIGAAIASAAAWVASAAPLVLLAALFAVLLLAAEDFYGYLHGKQSVIGALRGEFESFLNDFTRPREEPWFLKQIRFAIALLSGAKPEAGTANAEENRRAFGSAYVAQGNTSYVPGGNAAALAEDVKRWFSNTHMSLLPEADNFKRSVVINSPVTINGAGGSPKDIADQIGKMWEEQTAKAHRAAIGGIP